MDLSLSLQSCVEHNRALEKAHANQEWTRIQDILRALEHADAKGKLQALASSKLSKTVMKIAKNNQHQEVQRAAQLIVNKWKALLHSSKTQPASHTPPPVVEKPSQPKPTLPSDPKGPPPINLSPAMKTGDSTRDMVRQKLKDIFEKGLGDHASLLREHDCDPTSMAVEAEESLFMRYRAPDKDYKARFRSIVFNLQDKKNPEFILSVVSGQRHVGDLATMEVKEMASDSVKKQRAEWNENAKMALMDEKTYNKYSGKAQEDGILKCPKCKSMKTEYTEVQTRSADEPTTKKCFCNNCTYRWKFC